MSLKNKTKKISKGVLDAMRDYTNSRRDIVQKKFQLESAQVTKRACYAMLELEKDIDKEDE